MELRLDGKTALVCGSTQGIGRAIAEEFAMAGARVVLIARNEDALRETLATLAAPTAGEHAYLVADFTEPESVRRAVAGYLNEGHQINIVVNNSGGPAPGAVAAARTEEFVHALTVHLLCSQTIMQLVVGGMKSNGYGRFINIISTSVRQPLDGLGVSNTIRGAMGSWSKTLATELAPHGITVNNVLPGATKTGRLKAIIARKAAESGKSTADIEHEMTAEIPAKRFAEPREIAHAALFLASSKAAYVTGINLTVDGGRTKAL
ncbi:MAG: SDR family oxidoreductase [Ignavibacteria bacterium]|nr:SDR family oxidoreductase [Ignavibacteria bacterium]